MSHRPSPHFVPRLPRCCQGARSGLKVLRYRLEPRGRNRARVLAWEEGEGVLQNRCPIWGLAGREEVVGAGMDTAISSRDG